MRAGDLRRKITIKSLVATASTLTGEMVQSWSTGVTAWAAIEPLRGKEWYQAQQWQARADTRFTIRYIAGLNPECKIVYDGVDYNIESVVDVSERHRTVQLLAYRKE